MKRGFTWPRAISVSILLLAMLAWLLPTITEGWGRDRMIRALEEGLGRKVEVGQVRFRLVPTPGFAISDVRIGEDPALGQEPAGYVDTLVARPSLLALLTGRLAIGAVRLEDASLNLTRVDGGAEGVRWNFSSLATGANGAGQAATFPAIHMSGGRINFKFGDTKSIFYLVNTDVDLAPAPTEGGALKIEVKGQPARTDRPSRGFGSFTASGQWNFADHSMGLDVKLEKSELSDILSLFEGTESALLGKIWGDAHFAGPIARIGFAGHMNVADLHGWNQSPPGGSAFPFSLGGTIDGAAHVIDLAATGAGKPSPIGMRCRVADYLGRPQLEATVSLEGIPVAPLAGVARNFGIVMPPDLLLDGSARGTIGYSAANGTSGMNGQVRIFDGVLSAKDSPPLKIAQADLQFSGSSITLSPASIMNDAGESAAIEGNYDTASGGLTASLTSEGMAIASLRRQISVVGAPIVGLATNGVWSGSLRYANEVDGTPRGWAGDIHLKDTDIPFEAFSQPLHLLEADVTMDASGAEMKKVRLTLGGIAGQGDYRYEIGAAHPHRFRMIVPSADAAELEKLLTPALQRAGILTYAFNFGRVPEPDWLRNMHAEGSLQIGSLTLGATQIANVKASVNWDDSDVTFTGLTGRVKESAFTGAAVVHLAARQPRYELNGSLSGFAWRGGTLGATVALKSSGMGTELLTNLRAEGTFRGRRLEITAEPWESVEGRFEFSWARTTPKLKVSALAIQSGLTKWTGTAETQDGGQMVLKVVDGARHMEASGALLRGEVLKVSP